MRGSAPPRPVRGIAIDIDGTLTDLSRRVSCAAVQALRRQADRGMVIVLVTGNVLPIAYALRHYLGFNGPVVAENGGVVSKDSEVKMLGSKEEPMRAFEHLLKNIKAERIFSDRWRETEVAVRSEYDIDQLRAYVKDFDVKIVPTGWAHHIMNKHIDKSVGLAYVCDNWLKISMSEFAAIGDSDNDANMISQVGFGITLSNGSQKCKERAVLVTERPHGEGIIEALEWLGLEP